MLFKRGHPVPADYTVKVSDLELSREIVVMVEEAPGLPQGKGYSALDDNTDTWMHLTKKGGDDKDVVQKEVTVTAMGSEISGFRVPGVCALVVKFFSKFLL